MSNTDWEKYYHQTIQKPPSKLLLQALTYEIPQKIAIDLGAGGLRESKYLLEHDFDVTAVDSEPAMEMEAKKIASDRFHYFITPLQSLDFKKEYYGLALAIYSLPFIPQEDFCSVFQNIQESLVKDGIFCGQLFGDRDGWNTNPTMTFHTESQARELFHDMDILFFHEEEKDGTTASGSTKHWHVFHVIAQKR